MEISFKKYQHDIDFMRVREFLIRTYEKTGSPYNWTIERWNYAFYFVRHIFDMSLKEWEKRVGIWENIIGDVVGIVTMEGCFRGEAFILVDSDFDDVLPLEEMFEFAENNLYLQEKAHRILKLRILDGDSKKENIAKKRGFVKKEEMTESTSVISLDRDFTNQELPEGFKMQSMAENNNIKKRTLAFAKAFGNYGTEDEVKPPCYIELQKAPDYKRELDIYIEAPDGEFVSFCLVWYDEKNKIGILEPVGTIPNCRKRGFGKATNYEAINRVKKKGAEKVYVGDGQQFYLSIGFEKKFVNYIWIKEIPI